MHTKIFFPNIEHIKWADVLYLSLRAMAEKNQPKCNFAPFDHFLGFQPLVPWICKRLYSRHSILTWNKNAHTKRLRDWAKALSWCTNPMVRKYFSALCCDIQPVPPLRDLKLLIHLDGLPTWQFVDRCRAIQYYHTTCIIVGI